MIGPDETNEILSRVEAGTTTERDAKTLKDLLSCLRFIIYEETNGMTEFDSMEANTTWTMRTETTQE